MSDEPNLREQLCYQQNFEQARSLNVQMNQVPVLAITLTGGLWFGAGVVEDLATEIRFALLMFAGLCNLSLILAVLRIRDVLESYLEKIEEFNPTAFASGRPRKPKLSRLRSYSMITIYCTLMLIGAFFSFLGALWKYWPLEDFQWAGIVVLVSVLLIVSLILFWPGAGDKAPS